MRDVAGELVLQSQFFFFQSVEKVFVGMGPVLFLFDESVQRGMLRFQFLDRYLVHGCHSFRQSHCHHCVINHEMWRLS